MPQPRLQDRGKPVVIGLLGGVASGKSTVAAMFAERGLVWIDADRIAREVTTQPGVLDRIVARFGRGVLDGGGALDRARLAAVVFDDPAARADLEAIVHPAVRERIERALDDARDAGRSVLLDVPLLLERGLIERCNIVVFVDASDTVRTARAAARGWDARELARREAAQSPLDVKKLHASFTIDNSDSLSRTRDQVEAILARVRTTSFRGS